MSWLSVSPATRRRRDPPADGWLERHYYFMSHSCLGLGAAAIAETSTRVLGPRAFAGRPTPLCWVAVVLATVFVLVIGSRVISSRAARTVLPFQTARRNGSIGCHPPHAVPLPCPASGTAVAASTLTPTILELSGRFVLTMVDTTDPSGYSVSTRRLLLIRPDSATRARARARGLGHYPRLDLQQVGTATIPAFARPDTAE